MGVVFLCCVSMYVLWWTTECSYLWLHVQLNRLYTVKLKVKLQLTIAK